MFQCLPAGKRKRSQKGRLYPTLRPQDKYPFLNGREKNISFILFLYLMHLLLVQSSQATNMKKSLLRGPERPWARPSPSLGFKFPPLSKQAGENHHPPKDVGPGPQACDVISPGLGCFLHFTAIKWLDETTELMQVACRFLPPALKPRACRELARHSPALTYTHKMSRNHPNSSKA